MNILHNTEHSPSLVAFGDWHGNLHYAQFALRRGITENPGAFFVHVGDFGVWDTKIFPKDRTGITPLNAPKTKGYVHELNKILEDNDTYLYVVLGNHENYSELSNTYGYHGFYRNTGNDSPTDRVFVSGDDHPGFLASHYDDDGFIVSELFPRIKLVPRGHYWEWGNKNFASLGGAGSIDKNFRTPGVSWWEEELPTMDQARSLIDHVGGRTVDVMITHEIPSEAVDIMHGCGKGSSIDRSFGEGVNKYIRTGSDAVGYAVNELSPDQVISGHHHIRDTIRLHQGTRVDVLGKDESMAYIKHVKGMSKDSVFADNHIVVPLD